MVIAIDGPAGAGKSTVARTLAQQLGFTYLDSGAMYRCVALISRARPEVAAAELAKAARIELGGGTDAPATRPGPGSVVMLDGRDVTEAIRTPDISQAASQVAADPGVRTAIVARQRELIARGDWVVEGRDIGTVVAPHADLKIFLTADPQERARRRAAELGVDPGSVLEDMERRDERDAAREHSPMVAAQDALLIDTTGLEVQDVIGRIAQLARRLRADLGDAPAS
jgi:CMP/dCMP kinase